MENKWNDLQKPTTWNDIVRSEVPLFSSKLPINTKPMNTILDNRFNQIIAKHDYATYCDEHNILGNIFVYLSMFDVLFCASYLRMKEPRMNFRLEGITPSDRY